MNIISKETFDKFTKEEKDRVKNDYRVALSTGNGKVVHELENLFGKENLQPKLEIKTWDDVIANILDVEENEYTTNVFKNYVLVRNVVPCSDKIKQKLEATYKIAKLIELGYGGMVTEEEWRDDIIKHCAVRQYSAINHACMINDYEFVAFHTIDQYEEFMSYPENRTLVEQYFMI